MRPVGVDLFAGAGGMSLGFEQAGFDVRAAVEIDPVHCGVHAFNFPETEIIAGSVADLNGRDIRQRAGLQGVEIDCVFGGAPCQGFSLIGHRALEDPRNKLVLDFVRLVRELDARTFVFENVKGLTVGKHRAFLRELVSSFEQAGYECQQPWKVLNAAHYGTPQARERFILMGAKQGRRLPTYPKPLTNIAGRSSLFPGLPYGPNCADALADLPDADDFSSLLDGDSVKTTRFGPPSSYVAELRGLTNEAWHFGYARHWNPAVLTSSIRTDHTAITRRRFGNVLPGTTEPISRFFKLSPNGVANTLRAGTDGARGAFTSPRPIHFQHDRCITVREMARLHGFPDWFRFNATKWHGARQIGNAVPPPLARAIASRIIDALDVTPSRPPKTLALGDATLLKLDRTRAAQHFGVTPLASGRDRKSGATKRKQIDIEHEMMSVKAAHG